MTVEIICGPMFSGKSEELIRRLKRLKIGRKKVIAFKPVIDNRYCGDKIVSHSGGGIEAVSVKTTGDIKIIVDKQQPDVIGIDEVQFFDDAILAAIDGFASSGINVIAAGLDKDFRGEPFGPMPLLLAKADYVTKLDAVCVKCGSAATLTQRVIDGVVAHYNDPVTLVGKDDKYEARCRKCHEVRRS